MLPLWLHSLATRLSNVPRSVATRATNTPRPMPESDTSALASEARIRPPWSVNTWAERRLQPSATDNRRDRESKRIGFEPVPLREAIEAVAQPASPWMQTKEVL